MSNLPAIVAALVGTAQFLTLAQDGRGWVVGTSMALLVVSVGWFIAKSEVL